MKINLTICEREDNTFAMSCKTARTMGRVGVWEIHDSLSRTKYGVDGNLLESEQRVEYDTYRRTFRVIGKDNAT